MDLHIYAAAINPKGLRFLESLTRRYALLCPRLAAWIISAVVEERERREASPPIEAMPAILDAPDWTGDEVADGLTLATVLHRALRDTPTVGRFTEAVQTSFIVISAARLRGGKTHSHGRNHCLA